MMLQCVAFADEDIATLESPTESSKKYSYYVSSKHTPTRQLKDRYRESRRELRGRGGGRSSSSSRTSRSSYYRSYVNFNSATFKSYRYSYTTYASPLTRTNSYWNVATKRTYQPLYQYFLPAGFYTSVAYYSVMFGKMYYDGYGYNFYYGNYGYYEYSEHPPAPANETTLAIIMGAGCLCFCLCGCYMVYRDEQDEDESIEVEVTTVVDEKRERQLAEAHMDNAAPVFN